MGVPVTVEGVGVFGFGGRGRVGRRADALSGINGRDSDGRIGWRVCGAGVA